MTKKELATGMFGVDSNKEVFVVAGDKVIFECGKYNNIDDLDDNLMFNDESGIDALYEARCFQQVKDGRGKLIWKRPEPTEEAEEAPKTEEGAITITEDQFFDAVKKANELFFEIGKRAPGGIPGGDGMEALMGLQNITFGAAIGSVLFGKEVK